MNEQPWTRSRGADDSRVLEAHAAAAKITVLPPHDAVREVRARRECRTVEFAELMIGLARDQRSTSPRDQGLLARLAIAALDGLGSPSSDREIAALALAWAELGNSLRIRGKFTKAPLAIGVANRFIDSLPDSPVKIDVLAMNAAYHERRCELTHAWRILRSAERIAHHIGTADQLVKIWILQSDVLDQQMDHRRSYDRLLTSLQLARIADNRTLSLCCIHNLAGCCARSGFTAAGCLYEITGVSVSLMMLYATVNRPADAEATALGIRATAEVHGLSHQQHLADAYLRSGDLTSLHEVLSIW